MNKTFKIEGMTCASCTALIETETKKITGVKSISVNFASEIASIEVENNFDETQFFSKLESLGYRAENTNLKYNTAVKISEKTQAVLLLVFGSLLMLGMFFIRVINISHSGFNLFQLITCSVIFSIYSRKYLNNLLRFIKTFQSNMHTLIGLGVVTNLGYSYILYFKNPHTHLFVEGVPFILGFTILGQYFEKIAKTKAQTSLSSLYKLQIKFAQKIVFNKVENVPVIDLGIGDIIRIRPGEKIPVNGRIIKGESHTDESLVTGESLPQSKKESDLVISGSLNLEGSLDIEVLELFHDSSVAKIIKFIETAENKKTHIEIIADKIIKIFNPLIILIAIVTFFGWYFFTGNATTSITYFISVLVIACPCALGLAVPISIMISTREAAARGLLIDGGEVFEIGAKVDTIVLDKTGTLTSGHPEVESLSYFNDDLCTKEIILQLSASSCAYSSHPLAQAISTYARNLNIKFLDPERFKNIPGAGFISTFGGYELVIGSEKYLHEKGIQVNLDNKNEIGSKVHVAINNLHSASFTINDQIKKSALSFINNLKDNKIEIWMLTGDNQKTAESIANQLGINNIKSQVEPQDKANFILDLRKQNRCVAMIGDGVNDAIALSFADVSIAMSNGSDVAISSSKVSLLEGDLSLVTYFLELSKKTTSIIKQNLFFSFLYNVLCIPLAAGVFVSSFHLSLDPKWASLSMGLSSTSVILSSLRLKKFKD